MTASSLILDRLEKAPYALAVFELNIFGVSENAAATRLSELQKQGKVIGTYRKNCRYKEWALPKPLAPVAFKYDDQGQSSFA